MGDPLPLPAVMAARANAEKLKFVIHVTETGSLLQLAFQTSDGAVHVHFLDPSAAGTDQVIVMVSRGDESEVSGAVVQAQAAHHAVLLQFDQKAVDGRRVTILFK